MWQLYRIETVKIFGHRIGKNLKLTKVRVQYCVPYSIKLFPLDTLLFVKPYLATENKTLNRHLISHIIVIKKQPTICTAIFSPEWKRNSPVHLKSPCCLSALDRVAYYVRNRIFHKFWCCRDVFCVSQGMPTLIYFFKYVSKLKAILWT